MILLLKIKETNEQLSLTLRKWKLIARIPLRVPHHYGMGIIIYKKNQILFIILTTKFNLTDIFIQSSHNYLLARVSKTILFLLINKKCDLCSTILVAAKAFHRDFGDITRM